MMSWIKQLAERLPGGVNDVVDKIEGFIEDPGGTVAGEFENYAKQLRHWRDSVRDLDPAGVSEELWGEGGRFAYVAGAAVMAKRSPTGVPILDKYKAVLQPHFGGIVNRVTLHWGTDPLDKWAADRFSIQMTDVHTAAQTFGHDIYIRFQEGQQTAQDELELLVHELVHVRQFEKFGSSYSNFGYHYFKEYKKANQNYAKNRLEREAYEYVQETTIVASPSPIIFRPLRDGKAYFIRGNRYARFDFAGRDVDGGYPKKVSSGWSGISYNPIDAIVRRADKGALGKIYFFHGDEYVRYDLQAKKVDNGYPAKIANGWPGLWTSGIDAATLWPDRGAKGKIYFFRGNEYARFDLQENRVDSGYPKKISAGWPGVWTDGVDAAVFRPDTGASGKIYFFRGNEYIRFDLQRNEADDGYPRKISAGWPGVWTDGVDAVVI